jgi:hypothetical protein
MKQKLLLVFILFITSAISIAQVQVGGYVQTDIRMFLQNENRFYWNENRLNLNITTDPTDRAHIYSEIWIRNFGFPNVSTSADLMHQDKDNISPWSLLFREAYIDLYGFLLPELDIRIGLQRIAWGTADKFNPTDNLNPDDLEDIWDFGQHLGSGSIKASLYLDEFVLTAVFVPIFTPATLPIKEWAEAFSLLLELPPEFTLRNLNDQVVTPDNNMKESSMFGFKVDKNFLGYDLSLSYFYGRDDIPLVRNVNFIPVDTLGLVDLSMELFYPRIQVFGMDLAGAIGEVGFWVEGALFFTKYEEMINHSSTIGLGIQRSVLLYKKPYFKYVLGTDYTFNNGWYVNMQYIHGIFHERGENELGDYIVFALEKRLLGDKLKIIPFGGGIEIRKFQDISRHYAFIFNPELSYIPVDNAEVKIGFRLLEGKKGTVFGQLKENDEVYLRVRYTF